MSEPIDGYSSFVRRASVTIPHERVLTLHESPVVVVPARPGHIFAVLFATALGYAPNTPYTQIAGPDDYVDLSLSQAGLLSGGLPVIAGAIITTPPLAVSMASAAAQRLGDVATVGAAIEAGIYAGQLTGGDPENYIRIVLAYMEIGL